MIPLLLKTVQDYAPPQGETLSSFRRLIELSSTDNSFAKEEIENGFNTICSHHAITTWAAIETTIEQILVSLIQKVPTSITLIEKSVPNLNTKKMRTTTADDAKRTIRSWEGAIGLSATMDRTLHMLGAFGLIVELDEEHKRNLSELAELRNVILHKGGRIDKRFKDKCPWRQDEIGGALHINRSQLGNYFEAASSVATKLMQSAVDSRYMQKS